MLPVVKWLLGWLTGDLAGALTKAYQAKLDAQNEEQRVIADAAIEQLKAQVQAQANAKEIRLATAGFWEMRLITAVIAGCFSLHLLLVTLDTCFVLGWGIPKYPAPFDEWQGTILLSFFGVQVAGQSITAIASAIRGRR
ncbi:hypothetical protein HGP14_33645 [Rhizobium sp. P32RR-XVIII]|uniref:hypothetical protein n=1 Tax=Rhizobium sp. P32RR-XVIII TaxID=2726738 RepID=UPI0014577E50|nr:hypothetical protein [Rhizobium sp. P32RR-XVIII]NLS08141.1 hypothetical protein [Rhizobium sp. P32RR-XVIII]